MHLKALGAVLAAVGLLGAVVGVASATSYPGQPTVVLKTTPVRNPATRLERAVSLTGDNAGTCVLLRSGRVECWGDNALGALGTGTLTSVWYTDVAVATKGLAGVTRLVTDGVTYCALLRSGEVKCWGDNTDGALGAGSAKDISDVPIKVKGLTGVRSLVSDRDGYENGYGFCAVSGGGRVKCWGSNTALISGGIYGSGLLGDGGDAASSSTPVAVKGLTGVKSLASDQAGYCALLRNGRAECWGDNDYNELGDGKLGDLAGTDPSRQLSSNVPVAVKGLSGAASLASDGIGYCALLRSGGAKCWGNDSFGELGDGAKANAAANYGSDAAVGVKRLAGAVSIVSTDYGYCARLRTDGVKCWGYNTQDELGDGRSSTAQVYSDVPVVVKGVAGATSVVGGDDNGFTGSDYTYCALLKSHAAVCWGQNGYGELGDGGSESSSDVPVKVKGLTGAASLEVGTGSACAVLRSGGAECWGYQAGTAPVSLAGIGP
jgi:alpha-tubulin suppressor-like RCC1 family protein